MTYPETKKVNIVDTYDGIKVSDPYRWLEDDNAADTKAWVEAQNKVTFDYLAAIPARDKIKARLSALFNHERYGLPFRESGRYFWSKNDGLQPQSVLSPPDRSMPSPRYFSIPMAGRRTEPWRWRAMR